MTVLLAEDDHEVGYQIAAELAELGYETTWVLTGAEALVLAGSGRFRVLVLDLGLPDIDGIDVTDDLRHRRVPISIVFLTGRSEAEKVALRAGADRFLAKPCRIDALVDVVTAELQRPPTPMGSVFHIGRASVDQHGRSLYVDGQNVPVSDLEFRVVSVLAKRSPTPVPRSELIELAWPGERASSQRLRTLLTRLRGRLGDAADHLIDDDGIALRSPRPLSVRRSTPGLARARESAAPRPSQRDQKS